MEIHGTSIAQAARMRERPASSNPLLQVQPASVEAPKATEEQKKAAVDTDDGLDKYDISTIACTD